MKLHERMVATNLPVCEPQYVIVYEDPETPDAPCAVVVPTPQWLAMAMHGGILPPAENYLSLVCRWKHTLTGAIKTTDVYTHPGTGWEGGEIVNPELLHDCEPCQPLTEEQAMEYLLMVTVPRRVWGDDTNARRFVICRREQIPTDRRWRNAWRLTQ